MMRFMQSRLGPHGGRAPTARCSCSPRSASSSRRRTSSPTAPTAFVFKLAPLVVLMSTFLLFVVMPVGPDAWFADLDVGIFFALAVSSLSVIGILMAGWASANKYSLMGGLRAAGQLIAYELPMVLAVVGVVIQAGTLNLQGIVAAQANGEIFGFGGIGNPFILTQFVGFVDLPRRRAGRADPDARSTCRWPSPSSSPATWPSTPASASCCSSSAEFATAGRLRRHRRHAVPRRLGAARRRRSTRNCDERRRPARAVRQDDARRRSSSSGCASPTPASARTSSRPSPGSASSRSRWSNIVVTAVLKVAF